MFAPPTQAPPILPGPLWLEQMGEDSGGCIKPIDQSLCRKSLRFGHASLKGGRRPCRASSQPPTCPALSKCHDSPTVLFRRLYLPQSLIVVRTSGSSVAPSPPPIPSVESRKGKKEIQQDAKEESEDDPVLARCAAVLRAVGKGMPAERGSGKERERRRRRRWRRGKENAAGRRHGACPFVGQGRTDGGRGGKRKKRK
jgi:hypothetical protein